MKNDLLNIELFQQTKQPFYKALINAVNGITDFFQTERNGKIQFAIAAVTIISGFILKITAAEWIAILLCIAAVFALEMINSALENICNLISTDYNPSIKKIKDVAAGAVLIAACISAITGIIIFLPKILFLYEVHQIK